MLLLLILTSCRNESMLSNATNQEKQQDEFFSKLYQSLSNNPDKDKIIERIRRENEKSNFLSKINKHHGEAKFETKILKQTVRSSKSGKASDSIVYLNIPFGNDKYLTSVLFIEYSPTEFTAREIDNIKLRQLAYNENIDKQQRENLIMNYIVLDKMQYNSDLYVNIPATLFESIKKSDSALTKSFRIVNYKISSKSSPTARDGDITICIEIEDENCSCHGTHWECYEIGGGGTGNGDDGGTGGGTGTGGNGGDNSGGGGGDGTGTGNGNPENTDPCTDPNSPWYTHHSCGNSAPINVINFIQKMNNYGFNIAGYLQFLIDNPTIQSGFSSYLNNNNNQTSASFINWGLDFLIQNPDINWGQFQDWFIDGGNTDMLEFLADLNNPNIVKPTKRLKNNTRINCIFNKAKNAPNFKQYLQNFDGRFSTAHLSIDLKPLSNNEANAETSPPNAYWINITINSNNLNRPSLDVARTFMHEMIHAEMFRILLSLASTSNGQIDVSQLTTMLNSHNYPGIYDYFRRFGLNNMQHQQMSAHYIGIMKNYLKQIDNSITDSQAEAMSWVGLQGTIAWDDLGTDNQNTILNTYNSWRNNATHNCP